MKKIHRAALAAIFVGATAAVTGSGFQPNARLQAAQKTWDSEAEETFRLGRGTGRQLMTQEEWREHQQKMRTMSPAEREQYREQWHQKMVERAREKGVTLPDTPRPGKGTGPGAGPGPMGPGKGPGGGR